ncbi:MAG: FmdB family zinc ribbon protein [Clostridiales bacterium]
MQYSYRCPKCGVFTLEQSIKDEPASHCPTCKESVKRIIGKNVNVIYRTTGFYCTDSGAGSTGSSGCQGCDRCDS